MKTFEIPVSWKASGFVKIKANSLEKAIEIFDEKEDEISLPLDSKYIDGSFKRSEDKEFIAMCNDNNN